MQVLRIDAQCPMAVRSVGRAECAVILIRVLAPQAPHNGQVHRLVAWCHRSADGGQAGEQDAFGAIAAAAQQGHGRRQRRPPDQHDAVTVSIHAPVKGATDPI